MPNKEAFPEQVRDMLDGPYWCIIVRPEAYIANRITYPNLRPSLEQTQVRMRGWFFPHLSRREDNTVRGTDYYGTWDKWNNYEYWRFYESAQLIHYHGVREVVDESYRDGIAQIMRSNLSWQSPDWDSIHGYFDIINFLYTVTEAYVFASRLSDLLSGEQMYIEISLRNISGFILAVSERGRSFDSLYRWANRDLGNSWNVDPDTLLVTPGIVALDAVVWFFQRFGWEDVNIKALGDAQANFLRQRY